MIVIEFPLDWRLGKNKSKFIKIENGKARMKKSYDHQGLQEDLVTLIRGKMNYEKWCPEKKKTWFKIVVYKKDKNGDAVNLIDAVSDCVQFGIGQNDCWFAAITTWVICPKEEEKIVISISQNLNELLPIEGE